MKYISVLFTPTRNRRFNELAGFLCFTSALLLALALLSYTPLDGSFNTIASGEGERPASNWIGVLGALVSDGALQLLGVSALLLPAGIAILGMRWWKSREVVAPVAKLAGCTGLLLFIPALLAIQPLHWRYKSALPIEGLIGRILGDALIHFLNVPGAYIVSLTAIAVALYVTTTFTFGAVSLWTHTRFAFAFAAWERFNDLRRARFEAGRRKQSQETIPPRTGKPQVSTQLIPARRTNPAPQPADAEQAIGSQLVGAAPAGIKTGIERFAEAQSASAHAAFADADFDDEPEVGARADSEPRRKTVLPKSSGSYKLPPSSLLHRPEEQGSIDEDELKEMARVLVEKCGEFDVNGQVTHINPGPVVTTYEFKPEAGVKYSRITSLSDDLCLAMRAESILIERMAGKSTVGIQVPNRERETIWLREVVESEEFLHSKSKLPLALGKDINGRIVTADLTTMPHLLIAGSTGAGKSVAINSLIMSVLYKSTPDHVRMILVDPKRVELGMYEGVPHLYTPIITEPKLAANALRNAVREMERRLKVLAEKSVRNIDQYNKLFAETPSLFEDVKSEHEHKPLPYIVIIIDELADLMMLDGANVEEAITRLAQMARAVGIHLILATQRPSVDVITGLIKANIPTRISFRVATKIDSRTILDGNGAESLLGRGDMLYLPNGSARVQRVHAPFLTEKETQAVVEFWKAQGQAQYDEKFLQSAAGEGTREAAGGAGEAGSEGSEDDELFQDAVRLVLEFGKASTSLLQRRLRIGYGRAAHLIDLMEQDGIVGPADGPKPREILKRPDWYSEVEEALR